MYYNRTGEATCYELNGFDQFWMTLPNMQPGAWAYQRCTELIFPFEVPRDNMFLSCHEFERNCWNTKDYATWCDSMLHTGDYVNMMRPTMAIKYGIGRDIDTSTASKIAFINSELDPWSAGGVMHTLSSKAQLVSIRMTNGVHAQDLMTPRRDDSRSVDNARDDVADLLKSWLKQNDERANEYLDRMRMGKKSMHKKHRTD